MTASSEPTKRDAATMQEKLVAYDKLAREWRPHLTAAQSDTLFFLINQIIGLGKRTEDGRWSRELSYKWLSTNPYAPIRTCKSQFREHVAKLKEKGPLLLSGDPGRSAIYTINTKWTPPSIMPTRRRREERDAEPEEATDDPRNALQTGPETRTGTGPEIRTSSGQTGPETRTTTGPENRTSDNRSGNNGSNQEITDQDKRSGGAVSRIEGSGVVCLSPSGEDTSAQEVAHASGPTVSASAPVAAPGQPRRLVRTRMRRTPNPSLAPGPGQAAPAARVGETPMVPRDGDRPRGRPLAKARYAYVFDLCRRAWIDACAETFPTAAPTAWTAADRGRLINVILYRLNDDERVTAEFLAWTVRHWRRFIEKRRKDLLPPNDYDDRNRRLRRSDNWEPAHWNFPTLQMITQHFVTLWSMKANGAHYDWLSALPAERQRLQYLREGGHTPEEIALMVAEERVLARHHDELAARERNVTAREVRMVNREREAETERRREMASGSRGDIAERRRRILELPR
jgi:hypothetical protein